MLILSQMPEAIRDFLEARQLTSTAAFADENPAHLPPAVAAVAGLVLQSLAELAGQPTTRQQLWDLARAAAAAPDAPRSGGLTKGALADRYHGTTSAVAKETGVATATIVQLIDLAEGAALALAGGQAAEHHWDAQQLGEWLRPRRFAPVEAAPLAASAPVVVPVAARAPWLAAPANILLVLVSLVAVGEFGYILSTRSADSSLAAQPTATEGAPAAAPATNSYKIIPTANIAPARPAAVPVVLKLKNGLRQVIGATSTESKLYQFLIDPGQQVDAVDPTKNWIGFDRIYFESSKATLTNESLWQLSNVASILKRFPAAKIKIGGYTDNSGNALSNLKLSTERAQAAKEALVSLGVASERLTAVGYGVLDNIAPNETEEGRALNRRVSLQVTEK